MGGIWPVMNQLVGLRTPSPVVSNRSYAKPDAPVRRCNREFVRAWPNLTETTITGVHFIKADPVQDALHIYRVLFGFLYSHILNELQEVIERPGETDHILRFGLHRLAITEFPLLRAVAPALASYDGAAELDRGLDLLLPGLTATLTHPDEPPRSV